MWGEENSSQKRTEGKQAQRHHQATHHVVICVQPAVTRGCRSARGKEQVKRTRGKLAQRVPEAPAASLPAQPVGRLRPRQRVQPGGRDRTPLAALRGGPIPLSTGRAHELARSDCRDGALARAAQRGPRLEKHLRCYARMFPRLPPSTAISAANRTRPCGLPDVLRRLARRAGTPKFKTRTNFFQLQLEKDGSKEAIGHACVLSGRGRRMCVTGRYILYLCCELTVLV